jgi:hypothetical protein
MIKGKEGRKEGKKEEKKVVKNSRHISGTQ